MKSYFSNLVIGLIDLFLLFFSNINSESSFGSILRKFYGNRYGNGFLTCSALILRISCISLFIKHNLSYTAWPLEYIMSSPSIFLIEIRLRLRAPSLSLIVTNSRSSNGVV